MKIFNVMRSCDYVGEFYCGSFSTEEKAQEAINKSPEGYVKDLYVVSENIDDEINWN